MGLPIKYSIRNLYQRPMTTAMTAVGIALPVGVVLGVLALVDGLKTSLAATGHPQHVMVMRKGATSELVSSMSRADFQQIRFTPGLAQKNGQPMASLEMITVVMMESPEVPEGINITLRGLHAVGFEMREGVKVVEGQMWQPGTRQCIVGKPLAERYPMARIGKSLKFGRGMWEVVGVFDAGRSAVSSEIWCDLDQIAGDYERREELSTALLRAESEAKVPDVIKAVTTDRRFKVIAETERAYYEKQQISAIPIMFMGFMIAGIMAVGAAFGIMNTMYAAATRRSAEVGTLRAIGFSKFQILRAFLLESVFLSFFAGVLGCLIALPLNGVRTAIGNFVTFSEMSFAFRVGPNTMIAGVAFAVLLGGLGGLLPAWHAARKNILSALRGG
jgi:putative ABC transport system permease protein